VQVVRKVLRTVVPLVGTHEGARQRKKLHLFSLRESLLALHQPRRPQQDPQRHQEPRVRRLRQAVSLRFDATRNDTTLPGYVDRVRLRCT
jgi:hypothetical protein